MGKASRRPSFMMRGFGIVAAIALAIGIWLGGLFDDFGFDSGSGGGSAAPLLSANPENSLESDFQSDSTDQAQAEKKEESNLVGTQEVVVVIIDDRSYFLRADIGVTETRISLDALIKMVKNAKGDEDDIRLRVFRRNSARASTEMALKQSLADAQISAAAVQWVDEIIP